MEKTEELIANIVDRRRDEGEIPREVAWLQKTLNQIALHAKEEERERRDQQWLDKIKRAIKEMEKVKKHISNPRLEAMEAYEAYLLCLFKNEGIDLESITKNEND